jgi:hypothetical protein
MGITPISNLIPLPIGRALQADLEPMPMERVENSSRTGDETYSPSEGKSTRGSEDDASDQDGSAEFSDDPTPGQDGESAAGHDGRRASLSPSSPISFFA